MRRSILVAVLAGALMGLATVAGISLAGSGSSETKASGGSHGASQGSFKSTYAAKRNRGGKRHGHRRGHGMRFGPMMMALNGVADRLGVSKDELIEAAQGAKDRTLDRAVSEGTITQAQRDALEQCMKAHRQRGGKCDRRAARRAYRKLHRSFHQKMRTDAAALKAQLLGDLAAELGKQPDEVGTAIRAELSELLDMGVKFGVVTDRGRDLALGCWDRPKECDRKALRRELKQHFRGDRRGHRGRHP